MREFDRTPKIVIPEDYKPKQVTITLGGIDVLIYKMSLASSIRAVRIIEPYISEISAALFGTPAFQEALKGKKVDPNMVEGEIRDAAMGKLTEMIATVPETVMGLLACLMNFPEEGEEADFFWNSVDPGDLLSAIEKLDELNNFAEVGTKLLEAIRYLGKRYKIEIPGISIAEKETEGETGES